MLQEVGALELEVGAFLIDREQRDEEIHLPLVGAGNPGGPAAAEGTFGLAHGFHRRLDALAGLLRAGAGGELVGLALPKWHEDGQGTGVRVQADLARPDGLGLSGGGQVDLGVLVELDAIRPDADGQDALRHGQDDALGLGGGEAVVLQGLLQFA